MGRFTRDFDKSRPTYVALKTGVKSSRDDDESNESRLSKNRVKSAISRRNCATCIGDGKKLRKIKRSCKSLKENKKSERENRVSQISLRNRNFNRVKL